MSGRDVLRVTVLYPDRLNLYADRGNILILEQRCRRRGIAFAVRGMREGEELRPDEADLVYLGGGQDRDQQRCAEDLVRHRPVLEEAESLGTVILGICGGYQLLGHSYLAPGGLIPGLGLLDVTTEASDGPRLVGDVVVAPALAPFHGNPTDLLVGFENHQGRTTIGAGASPLGRVVVGHGNNDRDGTEGAVAGRVVGTYMHGPLLAKNLWLADRLISWVLGREPVPMPDRFGDRVHRRALQRALGRA